MTGTGSSVTETVQNKKATWESGGQIPLNSESISENLFDLYIPLLSYVALKFDIKEILLKFKMWV